MPKTTDQIMAGTLAQLGALSLVVGATLAVINQEIPNFKARALATLRKAIVIRPSQFSKSDAKAIAGLAAKIFSDLDDV